MEASKKMKALVLGATGQLGRLLSDELSKREINFVKHQRSIGDLTSESFVRDYVRSMEPTVIFNCSAWTDVDNAENQIEQTFKANRDSVEYISKAAKECRSLFVHVSTDYVFSGDSSNPWKINDEKHPISVYGKSKSEGEDLALENHSEGTYIFRTAWLYSKYGRNFAKRIIRLATSGSEDVSVVSDQIGQPTSGRDLAARILDTVNEGSNPGIYHATNSGATSWYDFAQVIFELLGSDQKRLKKITASDLMLLANRPKFSVLDQSGWSSTTLPPMRDWLSALSDDFQEIFEEVKKETAS